jgi:hypothetical protein
MPSGQAPLAQPASSCAAAYQRRQNPMHQFASAPSDPTGRVTVSSITKRDARETACPDALAGARTRRAERRTCRIARCHLTTPCLELGNAPMPSGQTPLSQPASNRAVACQRRQNPMHQFGVSCDDAQSPTARNETIMRQGGDGTQNRPAPDRAARGSRSTKAPAGWPRCPTPGPSQATQAAFIMIARLEPPGRRGTLRPPERNRTMVRHAGDRSR